MNGYTESTTVAEQRQLARRAGARLLLREDDEYPAPLRAIPDPPPFLLARGELRAEDALALAIVGSRHATPYGVAVAERLAAELAARGVTIVSGLARGIDTAAHRGALAAGGRTIAVLGCGVDVCYPPENRRLVGRVLERGALLSQFPLGTPALPRHFPLRNRTIAGLALGTIVVEAAERSGALITAGHAGELGREVFAVPGPVTSELSRGANRLIQDGAKLVQRWEDVVAELPEVWRRCLREAPGVAVPVGTPEGDEERVLALVGGDPVHIDQVIERSGVPSGRTAAVLLSLELKGWVQRLPGQHYVRSAAATTDDMRSA
ncbi:MAG: DNA-protecting protein DprA [Candidatus Rokubacteria bacterium]|nr:DNA-protecting protein DprA [Candidatus Rokubacteria bacterium]MBI2544260.1 DNA-protecting protein DprA [Candidatus Rokubacteria bacterium]